MTDAAKVRAAHVQRGAYVYLRQSTPHQVERNRESTEQQHALVSKATNLGWPSQQIVVIDEDLGLPGTGIAQRNGFAQLTAEVALDHVGIVLGLEVSCLARNNADWCRLLDLCGPTDTLIGDGDGIYHSALLNDHDGALAQWRLAVERASYEAQRAERRYRAVDPLCVVRKNVALNLRRCLWQ
jgi:DNA invertase Pin-like site-specific DNA recombinase